MQCGLKEESDEDLALCMDALVMMKLQESKQKSLAEIKPATKRDAQKEVRAAQRAFSEQEEKAFSLEKFDLRARVEEAVKRAKLTLKPAMIESKVADKQIAADGGDHHDLALLAAAALGSKRGPPRSDGAPSQRKAKKREKAAPSLTLAAGEELEEDDMTQGAKITPAAIQLQDYDPDFPPLRARSSRVRDCLGKERLREALSATKAAQLTEGE